MGKWFVILALLLVPGWCLPGLVVAQPLPGTDPMAAFHQRILAHVSSGNYRAALSVSDSTLMRAETPLNYYYQGWVNELMEAPQKAEWAYSKSIRIDTAYMEGYLALVRLYIGQNKLEKAILLCDKMLWMDQQHKQALLERSRIFALVHDYFEAIDDATLAIEVDSLYADAYYLRGLYHLESFLPEQAHDDLDKVISLAPDFLDAYLLRAETFFMLSRMDSALVDARTVMERGAAFPAKDYPRRSQELLLRFYRESKPPVITLISPDVREAQLHLPAYVSEIVLSGFAADESPIESLTVNGASVKWEEVDGGCRFEARLRITNTTRVEIMATDIYQNASQLAFDISMETMIVPERLP